MVGAVSRLTLGAVPPAVTIGADLRRFKGSESTHCRIGAAARERAARRAIGRKARAAPQDSLALLQRVFEVDALRCPRCTSTMRLIAAIEDPAVAERILECLKLPARPGQQAR